MQKVTPIRNPERTKTFSILPGEYVKVIHHGTNGKCYAVSFGFGGFFEYRIVWWFGDVRHDMWLNESEVEAI